MTRNDTKNETRVYAILGHPVGHSKSPAMHSAALRALNLKGIYLPFDVSSEQLPQAVRGMRALGFAGANITIPHKVAAMELVDELTPAARALGAVNTLVYKQGRCIGANTDAEGLVRALREGGCENLAGRVVILGAGGAARAAAYGLGHAGADEIVVAARRVEQAQALCERIGATVDSALTARSLEGLGTAFQDATLVVQATSATLGGGDEAVRFAQQLPFEQLPSEACVTDLVYQPRLTPVLQAASKRGLRVVDGLGMLLHQGALAFSAWTGQAAPLEVMREALLRSIASS